jgi:hypothetical protein
MRRALFMPDQDQLDLGISGYNSIVDGYSRTTGYTEYIFNAFILQAPDQRLAAIYLVLCHFSLAFSAFKQDKSKIRPFSK